MTDAKIEKLIAKHTILGYGIYFAIVEIIAQRLEPTNPKLEMEHDIELLSIKFRVPEGKIKEVIQTLIQLKLMQNTANGIACPKLLERLDNTFNQNFEIRKIITEYRNMEVPEKKQEKPEQADLPLQKNEERILKTRAVIIDIIAYFQEVCKLKKYKSTSERIKIILICLKKGRSPDDIKKAILNFSRDTWVERSKYMDLVYAIGVIRNIDNFEKWFNMTPKKW